MSEVIHAPGPWRLDDTFVYGWKPRIYEASGRLVCEVGNAEVDQHETWSANASLIVAAPCLLAALSEAVRYLEYLAGETDNMFVGPGMPGDVLAMARSAIARATGGSS